MKILATDIIQNQSTIGKIEQDVEYIHVGLAGTENYVPHLGMVLMSLLNSNPKYKFMFHLFLSGISNKDIQRLKEVVCSTDCIIKYYIINDSFFSNVVNGMYTASFFYRFIMPDIVKNDTHYLIYMDGDMMCYGDITDITLINLENSIAAVVSDRDENRQSKQLQVQRFFNSGMMIINVEQWVKESFLNKVLNFSVECMQKLDNRGRYKAWGNARYNDQNILNKMLDGRVLWLPKKYNYIYKLNRAAFFRKTEHNEDYKKQVILHFAGSVKPWHDWVKDWPVVEEYRKIWENSPWRDVPMNGPVSRKDYHQAAREYRITGQYGKALRYYWEYYKRKL